MAYYQPGRRSKSWLKIKSRMQQEAGIGGITEPSGSRKHFGTLMLGVYDQGKLRYVGHTGTGFSDEMLKDILKRLTPYFTDSCPFNPRPKADTQVQWVKPKLVCEVAFQENPLVRLQGRGFRVRPGISGLGLPHRYRVPHPGCADAGHGRGSKKLIKFQEFLQRNLRLDYPVQAKRISC